MQLCVELGKLLRAPAKPAAENKQGRANSLRLLWHPEEVVGLSEALAKGNCLNKLAEQKPKLDHCSLLQSTSLHIYGPTAQHFTSGGTAATRSKINKVNASNEGILIRAYSPHPAPTNGILGRRSSGCDVIILPHPTPPQPTGSWAGDAVVVTLSFYPTPPHPNQGPEKQWL